MTLNASGNISFGGSRTGESINLELGRSATAQISIGDSLVRTLLGLASGAIDINSAHGKSTRSGPDIYTTAGDYSWLVPSYSSYVYVRLYGAGGGGAAQLTPGYHVYAANGNTTGGAGYDGGMSSFGGIGSGYCGIAYGGVGGWYNGSDAYTANGGGGGGVYVDNNAHKYASHNGWTGYNSGNSTVSHTLGGASGGYTLDGGGAYADNYSSSSVLYGLGYYSPRPIYTNDGKTSASGLTGNAPGGGGTGNSAWGDKVGSLSTPAGGGGGYLLMRIPTGVLTPGSYVSITVGAGGARGYDPNSGYGYLYGGNGAAGKIQIEWS